MLEMFETTTILQKVELLAIKLFTSNFNDFKLRTITQFILKLMKSTQQYILTILASAKFYNIVVN